MQKPTFLALFTLLFTFLMQPPLSYSQVSYHHYLDSTYYWSEWSNYYYVGGSGTPCALGGNQITQRLFHVAAEEEINGEWWYAMHEDYQTTLYCGSGGIFPEAAQGESFIRLWIREDSTGKIWGLQQGSPPVVLFDFSGPLEIGDTLWMNNYQDHCPIANIDSISIGPRWRARYHCACDTTIPPSVPSYVIEGAGLNENILGFADICVDMLDNSFSTTCIGFGQDVFIVDSTYACGGPGHVSVGIAKPQPLNIDLRWNPDLHFIAIQSGISGRNISWQLVDVNGRILQSGQIETPTIPLEGFSQGVYFLQLREGEAFQSWKLPYY